MSQSLCRILAHIVFSTKERRRLIPDQLQDKLSAYLCGILKQMSCLPIEVNCVEDHAHILCVLSKNPAVAKVIEDVKKGSSKWMKTQADSLTSFYWQGGYACMSVSQSNLEKVRQYIRNQQEHHRTMSFQEELLALLERNQIEFDENSYFPDFLHFPRQECSPWDEDQGV